MPTTELHRAPATVTNLFRDVQANLTVGIESNGKGVMGLIVDLPGGFVRGRNEAEAIQKVNTEAGRYLSWIGRLRDEREGRYRGFVVGIVLDVVKPCGRCVVTTTDQDTAERGPEPLRTLATFRLRDQQVMFGMNTVHRGTGRLVVGAPVEVIAWAK